MTRYRLGLDLGTNSIGWCAVKLTGDKKPEGVLDAGVLMLTVSQEAGRDPQSKQSFAADRRAARSARRRRDRFLRRKARLMTLLVRWGLMPEDEAARKALERLDPYELRAACLDGPQPLHHIGRALFHINQRRGFQSNRIADGGDDEKSVVKSGIRALEERLKEDGSRTVGEWLAKRHAERRTVRARPGTEGYDFYPSRALTKSEIDLIWRTQSAHHPELTDERLDELLYVVIGQRKLKKPPVGRCTFRPDEERAHRAMPSFQRYRIMTDAANLEIERPGRKARKLSKSEWHSVVGLLLSKGGSLVKFEDIAKALKLPEDATFNLARGGRSGLQPDLTAVKLSHKSAYGKAWRSFPLAKQNEIVSKLLSVEDEGALIDWLCEETGLSAEAADFVANARLPQGTAHLGLSMLRDMIDVLSTEEGEAADPETGEVYPCALTYDQAIERLGLHHSDMRPGERHARLPYYGDLFPANVIAKPDAPEGSQERRGRLPNPTVHIGLNQLRRLINALVKEYGPPEQIVVELARELKLPQKRKDEIQRENRDNEKKNIARSAKLAELDQADTPGNRLRLRLYEELPADARVCVYSGTPINCKTLFTDKIEIDHILPFSTTLDDGFANKVLCTREANRQKGNRAPFDAFGQEAEDRARTLFGADTTKARRFAPDAMDRLAKDGDWIARQLTDTQHLAKLAGRYLGHICDPNQVWVTPGRLTAMMRGLWGLNRLLPDHNIQGAGAKNRLDHRHHAVDAFVVACTERRLLNKMAQASGRGEDMDAGRLFGPDGLPEPFEGFRDALRTRLETMIVAHKADHGKGGRLHEETAYGMVEEEIGGKRFNLVVRKAIHALTRKEIDQVRDPLWRTRLQRVAEQAEAGGTKLADALTEFGKKEGIRHIRVLKTEAQTVEVCHGPQRQFSKAYVPGDNHRVDIYEGADGKWFAAGLSTYDANARPNEQDPPDAECLMRLHKGDLIEADFDGTRKVYRVYRLELGNDRLRLAPHNEAGELDKRHNNPDDPFRWSIKSWSSLKSAGARQVRVDKLGRIHPMRPAP